MNGMYVRRNPPRRKPDDAGKAWPALYYEHEEGVWHMALNELPKTAKKPAAGGYHDDDDDDDDMEYDYYTGRYKKKAPTHEWVFLDGFQKERFRHDGDTIVPGAGTRWKHKHVSPADAAAAAAASAAAASGAMDDEDDDDEDEDDDDDDDYDDDDDDDDYRHARHLPKKKRALPAPAPAAAPAAAPAPAAAAGSSTAVAEIKEDDEEELPWQVMPGHLTWTCCVFLLLLLPLSMLTAVPAVVSFPPLLS